MDKRPLCVHEIELVIKSGPSFCNRRGVAQHADSSLDFGQIPTRYYSRRLIVDSDFETGWTPINKLQKIKLFINCKKTTKRSCRSLTSPTIAFIHRKIVGCPYSIIKANYLHHCTNLNGALCFDGSDGSVYVFGDNITSV